MRKLTISGLLLMAIAAAGTPAAAQMGGRLSVEPYVGYGFFGDLGDTGVSLDGDLALGGRVAYRLAPQWSVFGNFQRSTPSDLKVDHWSAGVEFSYVPRGGAEGMLPILLETLRIAMIFTFTGVMIAEMYASRTGIGHLIANWGENFHMPQLFAGVLILAVVAILFNEAVRFVEVRCSKWRT